MSLLLMAQDNFSPRNGLSPARSITSISSIFRRGSRTPLPEESDPQNNEFLSPRPTHRSTDSTDSRSVKSNTSRGRKIVRDLVQRLRSTSNVSNVSVQNTQVTLEPAQADFEKVEDWAQGFDMYNRFVTNKISGVDDPRYLPAGSTSAQEAPKADSQKERESLDKEFSKNCAVLTKTLTSSSSQGNFVHGLPEAVFDLALLWCPQDKMVRKQYPTPDPSWSWTGWTGAVNFPFDPYNCPDIRRFVRREQNKHKDECERQQRERKQREGANASNQKEPEFDNSYFKSEIQQFEVGTVKSFRPIDRATKDEKLRISYLWAGVPLRSDSTNKSDGSDVLRFSAYTISAANFGATGYHDDDFNKRALPATELLDRKGKHCGIIMDYGQDIEACFNKDSKKEATGMAYELVLLSKNRRCSANASSRSKLNTIHPPNTPMWNNGAKCFSWDHEYEDFDPDVYNEGEWKMLNVMLIEWFSSDKEPKQLYAERVAIGRVHEDAWNACDRRKKVIHLK